jgi:hypothetical protein
LIFIGKETERLREESVSVNIYYNNTNSNSMRGEKREMMIKEIYTFTRTLSDRVVIVLRRSRGRGADEDHREEEEAREFERKKKSSSGHFFSR